MKRENKELPSPRPRLHSHLWQAYQHWWELVELRKRSLLRISAVERGVSNLDDDFERGWIASLELDKAIEQDRKQLVHQGRATGPIWDWLTSIKGLGEGGLAAQLVAQVDDIARFNTVSKLWRFCGYAVIDGHREVNQRGEKGHYNRHLKSICYLIADQFIRHQTPLYADIYYSEKARQRKAHPTAICSECDCPWDSCQNKKGHAKSKQFSDAHIHNRAWRKMIKIFLQHFWLTWRQIEHLPVSEPYVEAILHHADIVRVG